MAIVTITSAQTSITLRAESVQSVTLHHADPNSRYRGQASVLVDLSTDSEHPSMRQLFYDTDAAAEEAYAAVAAAMERRDL